MDNGMIPYIDDAEVVLGRFIVWLLSHMRTRSHQSIPQSCNYIKKKLLQKREASKISPGGFSPDNTSDGWRNAGLVAEVAMAGKHHRDAVIVGDLDRVGVFL